MAIPQNSIRTILTANGGRVQLPYTDQMAEYSCPFGMYLGYSLNTPQGEQRWDAKVNDYALYQRVLNGNDSISVLWEGANEIVNKKIVKSVGRINRFFITDSTVSYTQAPLPASNDLISTQAVSNFEAFAEGPLFTTTDIFRLHMFPRRFGRTLFIANIIEEVKGPSGEILYQRVNFKSLQNELSTSGLAIEQFVHFGAPGQEYAMPIWNGETERIELDKRTGLEGVNQYQIEYYGNVAPISLAFGGRRVGEDVDQNHLIVPCIALNPKPSAFSNSAAPSTNMYIAQDMQIEMEQRHEDYKKAISAGQNAPFEKRQFQGTFKTGVIGCKLTSGSYEKVITDNEMIAHDFDISKIPSTNNYFYNSDAGGINNKLTKFTHQSPISMLWRNHLCFQHINEIPMSSKTSIKFNLTQVPILGGLINTLTFGLLPDTNITINQKKNMGISALVEAQTLDYASELFAGSDTVKRVPLDWFRNEDTGEMASALSTKSMNTCLRGTLTHWFAHKNLNEYSASSADAFTFNDAFDGPAPGGTRRNFTDQTTSVHLDGKLDQYVISQMYQKVIGAADYRLTLLRDGVPVWTGRYQTKGKRSATGSVHQIQHEMIMDPINKIKGASDLMGLTAPIDIDANTSIISNATHQVGVNKVIHLDDEWARDQAPASTLPIDDKLKKVIEIPIRSLYPLGAIQSTSDIILIKGYYEKGGPAHEVETFTLQVLNTVGAKDGDGKEYNKYHRITRWGVLAEVIAGGKVRLTAYDTGDRTWKPYAHGYEYRTSQDMTVHWESMTISTGL